jgi:nephrocystin-3
MPCRNFTLSAIFHSLLGDRYGWVPDSIDPSLEESQPWLRHHHEHSITELEIIHGVLNDPAMMSAAFFYFRSPSYIERLQATAIHSEFVSENSKDAVKLKRLKDRIRAEYAAGR